MKGVVCSVPECDRETRSWAGDMRVCLMHFKRWKKYGDVTVKLRNYHPGVPYQACELDECETTQYQRRPYCRKHWERYSRHGNPHTVLKPSTATRPTGPAHHNWTETPSYFAVHLRIKARRGSAGLHECPCGKRAKQWAYNHAAVDELFEEGMPYSANLNDYTPMCVSCHKKLDMAHVAEARAAA